VSLGYPFAFHLAANLILGLALLLAWRVDRAQLFSRDLGLAFLIQTALPPAYAVWTSDAMAWRTPALLALLLAMSGYLALLMLGTARLAGSQVPARRGWQMSGALFALMLVLALARDMRAVQMAFGILSLGAGALAARWLWRRGAFERGAGLLLVALGAVSMLTLWVGAEHAGLMFGIGAVLRIALGTALIFATLERSIRHARLLHERFFQLTERSHQGVGVMRGEEVLYANPAVQRIYGIDPLNEAVMRRWRETTIPEAERADARERHRAIVAGEIEHVEWEADRRRFDGSPLRLRFSAWRIDWDGAPAEQIVVSDITAVHNALREKLHQATHDELTGAPNRSALMQRLRQLASDAQPSVLVVLDIDRFALINNAHGPSVGDEVLRELARRLTARFGERADVMRLGEDEFALVARAPEPAAAAQAFATEVKQLLAEPVPAAGRAFYLDVSMGIALLPHTAADAESLLRAATAAMHAAKATPGTSHLFAQQQFEQGSDASLAAEQALRAGLGKQSFFLVFQPKVSARDRRPVGFEALLRWRLADGSLVPPVEFIPAAERTGLILPLGQQVLEMACAGLARWRRGGAPPVPVAINVSRWQLLDDAFAEQLRATLQRHDLQPDDVVLEITETAAMQHFERVRERAAALHARGLALSLDDFGTGLSSLTALRALALRELKIDRGLIAPLPEAKAREMVRAVCVLAHALGLGVVAEGIESEAQALAAAEAGCDALQGYHFARPLEEAAAAAWLAAATGNAVA
jgi:diguanylate cyclase (GGDEF)-like protein/PAS domain S-box-containing protein